MPCSWEGIFDGLLSQQTQLQERMYHNDKQPAVLKKPHTDYVWRLPQIRKEVTLENPAPAAERSPDDGDALP